MDQSPNEQIPHNDESRSLKQIKFYPMFCDGEPVPFYSSPSIFTSTVSRITGQVLSWYSKCTVSALLRHLNGGTCPWLKRALASLCRNGSSPLCTYTENPI